MRKIVLATTRKSQRNNLERATIRSYRGHFEHHIDKKIGSLLVAGLTRGDIAEFMDKLQDEGLSRAMTRKVLGSLLSALDKAMELDWMTVTSRVT